MTKLTEAKVRALLTPSVGGMIPISLQLVQALAEFWLASQWQPNEIEGVRKIVEFEAASLENIANHAGGERIVLTATVLRERAAALRMALPISPETK